MTKPGPRDKEIKRLRVAVIAADHSLTAYQKVVREMIENERRISDEVKAAKEALIGSERQARQLEATIRRQAGAFADLLIAEARK